MKVLIKNILIILSLLAVLLSSIAYLATNSSDAFYRRFATPQQKNLIIGTSRAAQGIQPSVLNNILNRRFFNYAFTASQSPYGPYYFNSIKKKLESNNHNGIFILEISWLSLMTNKNNPDSVKYFVEKDKFVSKVNCVTCNPNFEYIIQKMQGKLMNVLSNRLTSTMYLHNDGWLEVRIDNSFENRKVRKLRKIKAYNKFPKESIISKTRIEYLEKIIIFLKKYGEVYLVQIPSSKEIYKIGTLVDPYFDKKIQNAISLSDGYLDLQPQHEDFVYTDGNHITRDSGKKLSKIVAEWIKSK